MISFSYTVELFVTTDPKNNLQAAFEYKDAIGVPHSHGRVKSELNYKGYLIVLTGVASRNVISFFHSYDRKQNNDSRLKELQARSTRIDFICFIFFFKCFTQRISRKYLESEVRLELEHGREFCPTKVMDLLQWMCSNRVE